MSWNTEARNAQMDRLRELFGGGCAWPDNWLPHGGALQFAHRLPTNLSGMGRGKQERILDIKNHPYNYLLLCEVHHNEIGGITTWHEE